MEVWDVARRTRLAMVKADREYVDAIGFSHDGKTLATVGLEKIVRLWDARTGELIRELDSGARARSRG